MSTPKTLDIDPEINAMLAKVEKRKTDHLLKLGEIVLDSGIHRLVDAEELRSILNRERDRIRPAKAPTQEQEAGTANGTFPDKPAPSRKPKKQAEPQPELERACAPDLLASAEAQ